MKIGSGRFRGRRIEVPRGFKTRPTGSRLKKALFDIVAQDVAGARVLDLFAGAGSLGLEALSRGASRVVFVEKGRAAALAITNNLRKLGVVSEAEVLRLEARTALRLLAQRGESFQLILLDPPYGGQDYESVLEQIEQTSLLPSRGVVIVEHHHKRELGETFGRLRRVRRVRAGESCLTFYRPEVGSQ